ncbi:putative G-protein coupled receptor 176 [Microtus ochrogaster]|uniref:Putative G-protein coupled receptor 176 n=1 Tax=Microtus ochrogaster TaxID=79684 RepID=A0A8J6GRQ0_MICOH|nr:putative G-protein coupled receptor 176 [Microtus ochrogaster]
MGHNNSWVSPNTSHPRNTSGAEAGANRSALGELSEAHLYRQFTITVQVIIFIGSLLGSGPFGGSVDEVKVSAKELTDCLSIL